MFFIVDLIVYIVFRANYSEKKSDDVILAETSKLVMGLGVMFLTATPAFLILAIFPPMRHFASGYGEVMQMAILAFFLLSSMFSTIFLQEKRYTYEKILLIHSRYGKKLPKLLAIALTFVLFLLSFFVMLVTMVGAIAFTI